MELRDDLSKHYSELLEGTYDCPDRIVISAQFRKGCTPGGFRLWFRALENGSEKNLNNTYLIRMAGRLSRRVHAFCEKRKIPLIHPKPGEQKHEMAEELIPKDPNFTGLFAVFVARAQGPVWDVKVTKNKSIFISRKHPIPYINHYFFHFIDHEWGHVTIRMAGHAPFNALVILNGHEWVERHERSKAIFFTKEGNCFTQFSGGETLSEIADTLSIQEGLLEGVCNRWIHSCLWFAIDYDAQKRTGFSYSYYLFQLEYSRNLLFKSGKKLTEMYENLITLTRTHFDIKSLSTILGKSRRSPYHKSNRPEIRIEKPDYNLTVFKIQFSGIMLKLYDKGERILRAEVVVHKSKAFKTKRAISNFQEHCGQLRMIMNNFMNNLLYSHVSFLDDGSFNALCSPKQTGDKRLAGINIMKKRDNAIMETVLALSIRPGGYRVRDIVSRMNEIVPGGGYTNRNASYDLKKLRGKMMVEKIPDTTRYRTTQKGFESILAIFAVTRKTLSQLLASLQKESLSDAPVNLSSFDKRCSVVWDEIKSIYQEFGIAA
jgi:hypothetical protein